ncbi:alpha-1,3/1,6-mannosyltransferase ALG2-like [Lingula anatina]|uniref:Alpha-1,3/1,6-mannosyltransferase ALG2 n=1 Tax=Lingula anatina TaxID=7574 RepID=A0A1S3HHC2_LINAN|nr:alpha-1,3/1,6-mannosyltransferase ALG2-like [Lingula anatina]|eukprot:XP_013385488.1 alpha-1,3/1,6-mannosyltransferase ALG2-like [Lingula anatina]
MTEDRQLNVVFIHPDLGIGGAERAVVDAALALKSSGHSVQFVTAHHDPSHCFEETRDGQLKITAVGDWLPRHVFGRCAALCAYIRMIYAAIYLVFFSDINPDIIFCDQISACIPFLRISRVKIIFYCHFPDLLLTQRQNMFKRLYRWPIDWLEEWTTGMAHCILVNSKFTAGVFKDTFKTLGHINPEVLYPIPNLSTLGKPVDPLPKSHCPPKETKTLFLSINRYERKKNLGLAIEGLAKLKESIPLYGIHLIMAGGYDERVTENKEHYLELKELAEKLGVQTHVSFIRSFSDSEKRSLLSNATSLIYTPDKEHFGIVPVEAMFMQCPVIAVRSGGPVETVDDKVTGFLCDPTPQSFSESMLYFVKNPNAKEEMGRAGKLRVIEKFSFQAFSRQLNNLIMELKFGKEK